MARGFTTLLVGLELANMLREQYASDAPPVLDTFLRFEQLASYARLKIHKIPPSEVSGEFGEGSGRAAH